MSVALLILAVGFFYFEQMKGHYLKSEEFSIIEYARHIKMNESLEGFGKEFTHIYLSKEKEHIDIRNFTMNEHSFSKLIPMRGDQNYLQISKATSSYDSILWTLKKKIIFVQVLLLLLFGYISYLLARNALKPLQDSIKTLDKFAKDLIHDLNTPVTSIKLNMKLLEKNQDLKKNAALNRINKSVHTISELHENLTILLQEETFLMQQMNLCEIIDEVVQVHKQLYPDIQFILECLNFKAKVNQHAIKQILQNIISNAAKYNVKDGYVKIYVQNNSLYIENSGKGIKEPDKIFQRSYSREGSSGLGLDIVKRLADAMGMKIDVQSTKQGSIFILSIV